MSLEPGLRVIVGGTLIDGLGHPPIKDSIVVLKDEWIHSVGKRGQVEVPAGSELIDAQGRTVLPGFIDAHTHFLWMGIEMMRYVDLSEALTLAEAVENVESKVEEAPEGAWILGKGWDDSKWPERRYITKEDLDKFSPNNPIMLIRVCGHLVSLNFKALELAGITCDTKAPPGGKIDRDEKGNPIGILREARQVVERVIPPIKEEEALEGLTLACDQALRLGCTSIHEAGLNASEFKTYQRALKQGELRVRSYLMMKGEKATKAMSDLGLLTGFGSKMLRLGSSKIFTDGSMGARTAALFEPYEDDPETKGTLMMEPEELDERVKAAHNNELQVAVHAIGDRGIEYSIKAIDEALKESPRKDHRHRIEHSEVLTTTQIERLKQLGIVVSMQPNFVGEWSGPDGMYEARLGTKRLRQNNPYRLLIDEGIHIAFGSDCMPFSPLYGIWSAVNHPIRESRISVEEAVRCYTLNGAFSSFEEELKGSVEAGKLADITIIEEDISEISKEKIKDVQVYMTIIGGKILYVKDE